MQEEMEIKELVRRKEAPTATADIAPAVSSAEILIPEDPIKLHEHILDLREEIEERTERHAAKENSEKIHGDLKFSDMVHGIESTPEVIAERQVLLKRLEEAQARKDKERASGRNWGHKAAVVLAFITSMFTGKETMKHKSAEAKFKTPTESATK